MLRNMAHGKGETGEHPPETLITQMDTRNFTIQ